MHTENFSYSENNTHFQGYIATENPNEKRPAVIVVHDWSGCNHLTKQKAEDLAKLGYVGIAIDMFGEGKTATDNEEKMKLIQPLLADRPLLQRRIQAALQAVQNLKMVDKEKIAAIGFCFGGLCVLDLARTGVAIRGVVTFHGILIPPAPPLTQQIKAKVLTLHGHDDPMVPPEQVAEFEKEMTEKKVNWQVYIYGNTSHAFTNPEAHDTKLGTIYNPIAAKRSWQAMQNFLTEIFSD